MKKYAYLCGENIDVMPSLEVQQMIPVIQRFFAEQPVERAYLFGSCSRGEETQNSDVDIMVSLSPDTKMGLSYFGMICDLEKVLQRPVDMVVEGDILPFAQASVNRDKVLIYERATAR